MSNKIKQSRNLTQKFKTALPLPKTRILYTFFPLLRDVDLTRKSKANEKRSFTGQKLLGFIHIFFEKMCLDVPMT